MHRDVKPQNVLLTPDGEAKVTDFGIARSLDVEHGVTQTGTVLGTSNYLSPEQASGQPVTPATDVYSLGVVLYELLTGEVPFPGENFVAIAMKHVNEPVPDITVDAAGRAAPPRRGGRARAREGSGAAASARWTSSGGSCASAWPSSRRSTAAADVHPGEPRRAREPPAPRPREAPAAGRSTSSLGRARRRGDRRRRARAPRVEGDGQARGGGGREGRAAHRHRRVRPRRRRRGARRGCAEGDRRRRGDVLVHGALQHLRQARRRRRRRRRAQGRRSRA